MLPPLSDFILSLPASSIADDPARWLENCLINGTEYLVLVDRDRAPVRALTLHQLIVLTNAASEFPTPFEPVQPVEDTASPPEEMPLLPTPQQLGVISGATATAAAVRRVAAAPELCWVVVDAYQRYQGLLDKSRLLAAAVAELTAHNRSAMGDRVDLSDTIDFETKASKSNTALLTYLGHELKTPLTSLLGLSSLLKIGGLGELSPRQNRYIGLIQQHCRRLANWVNTLIDLGRIESGTLKLIPQMVDLAEVWPDSYHQAVLRTSQEDVPPPPLPGLFKSQANPITLVADPNRLRQMLSCLMQTALVAQSTSTAPQFPLRVSLWGEWLSFAIEGLEDLFSLEQFSQTAFTLPFPAMSLPSTPISAEMGHWLEWLLMRKLAQYHRGELVFVVNAEAQICPSLILPTTPVSASSRDSRLLLVVAPLNWDSLPTLWRQAQHLKYRLLITPHIKDAVEIATYLPLSAILVFIQADKAEAVEELQGLQAVTNLTIALVPPHRSALLGELPVDRELLWPTDRLGSVLLQPPPVTPAPNRLTILYLRSTSQPQGNNQKFPNIFHDFGCRVLEVDDLEQASLLKRVWKPDVAVLDPAIADPLLYLQNFSNFPELSSLPLITLTMAATQAAHGVMDLSVFPCLVEESSWSTPEATERLTTWLIQVLQVAATPAP